MDGYGCIWVIPKTHRNMSNGRGEGGGNPGGRSGARDVDNPLESLICPITRGVFEDPVVAADGHTYEREAIQQWLASNRRTSPATNLELASTALLPNHLVRQIIQELRTRNLCGLAEHDAIVPLTREERSALPETGIFVYAVTRTCRSRRALVGHSVQLWDVELRSGDMVCAISRQLGRDDRVWLQLEGGMGWIEERLLQKMPVVKEMAVYQMLQAARFRIFPGASDRFNIHGGEYGVPPGISCDAASGDVISCTHCVVGVNGGTFVRVEGGADYYHTQQGVVVGNREGAWLCSVMSGADNGRRAEDNHYMKRLSPILTNVFRVYEVTNEVGLAIRKWPDHALHLIKRPQVSVAKGELIKIKLSVRGTSGDEFVRYQGGWLFSSRDGQQTMRRWSCRPSSFDHAGDCIQLVLGPSAGSWLLILDEEEDDESEDGCRGHSRTQSYQFNDLPDSLERQLSNCYKKGRDIEHVALATDEPAWFCSGVKKDGSGHYSWVSETDRLNDLLQYYQDFGHPASLIRLGNTARRAYSYSYDTDGQITWVGISDNGSGYEYAGFPDALQKRIARSGVVYALDLFKNGGYYIQDSRGWESVGIGEPIKQELYGNGGGAVKGVKIGGDGQWVVLRNDRFASSQGLSDDLYQALAAFYKQQNRRKHERHVLIRKYDALMQA